MLFDEPTTGLDPVIGLAILKLIDSCRRRLSFTAIIVSHEIPRVFEFVDRVVLLHKGVIWAEGTSEEFMTSEDPYVQVFTGKEDDLGGLDREMTE
jgi:phospholipid/cholesterol/gamma-HCH transport system ATP-binding protein